MNIPARYCTGYISDIGLPPPYGTMDFAAWIEVYLGGRWHVFDPRNNAPRIGRILIARGRDAADVPITHTFGPNLLSSFRVWTDEVGGRARMRAARRHGRNLGSQTGADSRRGHSLPVFAPTALSA